MPTKHSDSLHCSYFALYFSSWLASIVCHGLSEMVLEGWIRIFQWSEVDDDLQDDPQCETETKSIGQITKIHLVLKQDANGDILTFINAVFASHHPRRVRSKRYVVQVKEASPRIHFNPSLTTVVLVRTFNFIYHLRQGAAKLRSLILANFVAIKYQSTDAQAKISLGLNRVCYCYIINFKKKRQFRLHCMYDQPL